MQPAPQPRASLAATDDICVPGASDPCHGSEPGSHIPLLQQVLYPLGVSPFTTVTEASSPEAHSAQSSEPEAYSAQSSELVPIPSFSVEFPAAQAQAEGSHLSCNVVSGLISQADPSDLTPPAGPEGSLGSHKIDNPLLPPEDPSSQTTPHKLQCGNLPCKSDNLLLPQEDYTCATSPAPQHSHLPYSTEIPLLPSEDDSSPGARSETQERHLPPTRADLSDPREDHGPQFSIWPRLRGSHLRFNFHNPLLDPPSSRTSQHQAEDRLAAATDDTAGSEARPLVLSGAPAPPPLVAGSYAHRNVDVPANPIDRRFWVPRTHVRQDSAAQSSISSAATFQEHHSDSDQNTPPPTTGSLHEEVEGAASQQMAPTHQQRSRSGMFLRRGSSTRGKLLRHTCTCS